MLPLHQRDIWYRERELNSWPTPYQDAALPLSYLGILEGDERIKLPPQRS